jgi:hypothetical protein
MLLFDPGFGAYNVGESQVFESNSYPEYESEYHTDEPIGCVSVIDTEQIVVLRELFYNPYITQTKSECIGYSSMTGELLPVGTAVVPTGDVFRVLLCKKSVDSGLGAIYDLKSIDGMTVTIDDTHYLSIGDVVFLFGSNNKHWFYSVATITLSETGNVGRMKVGLEAYEVANPADTPPTDLTHIGWIDVVDPADAVNEANALRDRIRSMRMPAPISVVGVLVPDMIAANPSFNTDVLVQFDGYATVNVPATFFDYVWRGGDVIVMMVGISTEIPNVGVPPNKIIAEVIYGPHDLAVPEWWTSVVWRGTIGQYVIERSVPYERACQVLWNPSEFISIPNFK